MLYSITIGLNDKDTKQPMSFESANKIVEEIALKNLGYSSTYLLNGTYTHKNGEQIHEKSIKFEYLGTEKEKEKVIITAKEIKEKLNQESVLYQEIMNNVSFI